MRHHGVTRLCIQGREQGGLGLRLIQHGQLVERLQPQIIQKLARRGEQGGTPHRFPVTDLFHPPTVFQLFDDQAVDRHAANVFDITTCHGLTVGDDGQSLQHSTAVARWLLGVQLVEEGPHFRAALKAPTRRHLHQFHPTTHPLLLQAQQQVLEGVRPQVAIEQRAQIPQRQRLLRTDQSGFQNPFGVNRMHGSSAG